MHTSRSRYGRWEKLRWTVFFPSKIVVQIPGPYILFVESVPKDTSPGDKSRQSTSSVHWGASNNLYGNMDDEDTSPSGKDAEDQAADVGSEDSDAKRIAKTTSIQMGRMTFKVVGKTALRDGGEYKCSVQK